MELAFAPPEFNPWRLVWDRHRESLPGMVFTVSYTFELGSFFITPGYNFSYQRSVVEDQTSELSKNRTHILHGGITAKHSVGRSAILPCSGNPPTLMATRSSSS
jgi:hypothetical protein